jgi:hypothetical protein
VNPPNSTLKEKMVFDVKTDQEITVWLSGSPPEKPKDDKKDDKGSK